MSHLWLIFDGGVDRHEIRPIWKQDENDPCAIHLSGFRRECIGTLRSRLSRCTARRSEGRDFSPAALATGYPELKTPDIHHYAEQNTSMKSKSSLISSQKLSRHDKRVAGRGSSLSHTVYHYQATAEAPVTGLAVRRVSPELAAKLRSLRQLSDPAKGAESRWQFVTEVGVLGLVVAIVAWSLVSLLIVLAQTALG